MRACVRACTGFLTRRHTTLASSIWPMAAAHMKTSETRNSGLARARKVCA